MPAEKPFQPMKKGEPPSMIDADVANPVLDTCAAFTSLTVIPQGAGTLKVAGRTAVLDLTGLAAGGVASGSETISAYFIREGVLVRVNLFTDGEITAVS